MPRRGLDALPSWALFALIAVIAVAAVSLRLAALDVGLMSDDYAQHAMIRGLYPGQDYVPFDLYAFFRNDPEILAAHIEAGTVPWWTTPDLHGTVMRPLASLLRTLDYTLWPSPGQRSIRLAHAHSLAWLAMLIGAAGLALFRALPRTLALVALIVLACEAGYATPLGWLANRCSLISATFVCLTVWAHLGWRLGPKDLGRPSDRPRRVRLWIGLELGFASLALASGEYGLAAPAYVLGLELLAAGQAPSSSSAASGWRDRTLATAPILTLTLAWFIAYRALGYGTTGSAVYVDPSTQPGVWLELAGERLTKLVAGGLWGVPADTADVVYRFGRAWIPGSGDAAFGSGVYLRAHLLLAAASLVLAALVWALVRRWLEPGPRRVVLGLGLGALLALIPTTVAPAHTRLLVTAQPGLCALIAAVLVAGARGLSRWREHSSRERAQAALAAPLLLALASSQTLGELRWTRTYLEVMAHMNASIDAAFERGDLLGHDLEGREVITLSAVSQTLSLHGHYWIDAEGAAPPTSWRTLAMAEFPSVAYRADANTLELSAIQGAWLRSGAELFFRRQGQGMPAGSVLDLPGLGVEVLADDGEGHPTQIKFTFPVSLDDPRYLFVVATNEGLRRWQVPPVGGRAPVPRPGLPGP